MCGTNGDCLEGAYGMECVCADGWRGSLCEFRVGGPASEAPGSRPGAESPPHEGEPVAIPPSWLRDGLPPGLAPGAVLPPLYPPTAPLSQISPTSPLSSYPIAPAVLAPLLRPAAPASPSASPTAIAGSPSLPEVLSRLPSGPLLPAVAEGILGPALPPALSDALPSLAPSAIPPSLLDTPPSVLVPNYLAQPRAPVAPLPDPVADWARGADFAAMDADESGHVDRAEMNSAASAAGFPDAADALMAYLDGDGDGRVEAFELAAAFPERRDGTPA
eukprot:gene3406-3885_t